MALTDESARSVIQRKAKRAQGKVRAAEADLVAANEVMKEALPRKDVEAITEAAQLTVTAEEEVREAAHDLEVVNELLQDAGPPPADGRASGEGLKSLLDRLKGGR
jgi:hypothetical protein